MKPPALLLLAVLALADPRAAAHDVTPGVVPGGGAEPTQAEITRRIEHARGLAEAKGRMVRQISGGGFADASTPGAVYTGQRVYPAVHSRTCGKIQVGDIVQRLRC